MTRDEWLEDWEEMEISFLDFNIGLQWSRENFDSICEEIPAHLRGLISSCKSEQPQTIIHVEDFILEHILEFRKRLDSIYSDSDSVISSSGLNLEILIWRKVRWDWKQHLVDTAKQMNRDVWEHLQNGWELHYVLWFIPSKWLDRAFTSHWVWSELKGHR